MTMNGRQIEFKPGQTLLQAAAAANIDIPSLCYHPRLPRSPGTCRVCLVNVDGRMLPACVTEARAGQVVEADSEEVRAHVRGQLALLRANHPDDCMVCDVDGRCEFQRLINLYQVPLMPKTERIREHRRQLELKAAHFTDSGTAPLPPPTPTPTATHATAGVGMAGAAGGGGGDAILVDLDKCIKCGRCVTMCQEVQGMNVLGWVGRGGGAHVGVILDGELAGSRCIECGQCVSVCPVGALTERTQWREVLQLLRSRRKVVVAQTAPAVRVAIGEEVGLSPGVVTTGQLVTALHQLGFAHVFDTNFAADLTIMEEGTELLQRLTHYWTHPLPPTPTTTPDPAPPAHHAADPALAVDSLSGAQAAAPHAAGPLPMFTSCCPAWVAEVEKEHPELLPHLSTCRSPQGMMGSVVKRVWAQKMGIPPGDIVLVSIMPCTAKKHEARREELLPPPPPHPPPSPPPPTPIGPAAAGEPGQRPGPSAEGVEESGSCELDVDYVVTTRELGAMLRQEGVPLATLPEGEYDHPLGTGTGAAVLFGATGGVMEAALRTVNALVGAPPLARLEMEAIRGLEGVKAATLQLEGAGIPGGPREVRVAVVSGIGPTKKLLEQVRDGQVKYDFIEVMACPGGCIGGGGQPKAKDPSVLPLRMQAVYSLDERASVRQSHLNPDVQALYDESLGAPGGATAHELLHTHYTDRSKEVVDSRGAQLLTGV